jgi:uncharacterized protein
MQDINQTDTHYKITYNGKNITEDISLHLLELKYTDNVSGVADELEITVEDTDGKWSDSWYPDKGATLLLELGLATGPVIKPNAFDLDEIELDGSKSGGDVVIIKGISGGVNKQLHTKRSHAHENKTLGEIVRTTAARYGMTVIGTIENITIARKTQHREKDLTFLARLADEYGYAFSIKGNKLSFVKLNSLEAANKVATVDKTDCLSWNIKDKSSHIYQGANVKSHNPNTNKLVKSSYTVKQVANNDGVQFNYLATADNTLEVRNKTENEAQGNVKAEAALHRVNSLQQTANVTMIGNPLLVAGVNFELTGFGRCSGIWNILKSTHTAIKSGDYITEVELKRVVPATISKSAKKAKTIKPKSNSYTVATINNLDAIPFSRIVAKQDGVLR